MERHLKIIYAKWLGAVVLGWATLRGALHVNPGFTVPPQATFYGGPVLFILTAACALAGPIFYRTLFAHAQRNHAGITAEAFFIFERNLILIGQVALGFAMLADFLAVPFFYRSGACLTALYGVYCVFPSGKRIVLDRRLFRVATNPRKTSKISTRRNPIEPPTTLKKVGQ